jgi:hypothetical protein
MSYKQKYLKYKEKYLNLKQIGGKKCPTLGYNSHRGECWYNCQSFILSFCDIISERITEIPFIKKYLENISEKLLEEDISDFIRKSRRDSIFPINILEKDKELFYTLSIDYIRIFLNRLKNKKNDYDFQDAYEDSSRSGEASRRIPSLQRKLSMANTDKGVKNVYDRLLINLKKPIRNISPDLHDRIFIYNIDNYDGGSELHMLLNLELFNYYFQTIERTFINFIRIYNNKETSLINVYKLTNSFIDKTLAITITIYSPGAHQILLYKCNGICYIYNDNMSTVKEYDWVSIMKDLILDYDNFLNNLLIDIKRINMINKERYNKLATIECYYIDTYKDIDEYYMKQIVNVNVPMNRTVEVNMSIFDCYNDNAILHNILNLKNYKENKELFFKIIQQNNSVLEYMDESLKRDEESILEIINKNGTNIRFADNSLKINEKIVLEAVKQNGFAINFIDQSLIKNKDIYLEAVKQNTQALRFIYDGELKAEIKDILKIT